MRTLDTEFDARLRAGATTICLCWQVTRHDGIVLAVTDHDRPLVVNAISFAPGASLQAATFSSALGLQPGQGGAGGALSHAAITEADLHAGLWDGARIDVLRADWTRPDLFVHVWRGQMTEVTHGALGFEAELVSQKAALERPTGRVYAKLCDAALGDARCGVDVQAFGAHTCDQRLETCTDVFGNSEHFRGFPHLPGTDFILKGPAASGNTGGRR
jgi:hypothetical protein